MKIEINGETRVYKREKHDKSSIETEIENKLYGVDEQTGLPAKYVFYRWPGLNYKGSTNDTDELYEEIISAFLIKKENIRELTDMEEKTRLNSYIVHEKSQTDCLGLEESVNIDNMGEVLIAKYFWQNECEFQHIGKITEYQIPLKDHDDDNKDNSVGAIDLLSVNEDKSLVFLIELKDRGSDETMLRCVLEGYTYYKILDKNKLLENLKERGYIKKNPSDYKIVIAPLVFYDSQPYRDIEELSIRKHLGDFIRELDKIERNRNDESVNYYKGIYPYFLMKENGKYDCYTFDIFDYQE